MSTRTKRLLQLFMTGLFSLVGLSFLLSGILHGSGAIAATAVIPFVMAAVFYGLFEVQLRSYARAGKAVMDAVTRCSTKVFDAPGRVFPGYDLDATMTSKLFAGLAREPDNNAAFTTEGTFGDTKVSVASHVSVMGRQMGEFHHTYSHVCVDMLGLNKPFAITRERLAAKFVKAIGATKDVQIGDKAFDEMFLIATDEGLAKSVLDDGIRKRLMSLQAQVKNVSADMGVGGMTLVLSASGLALRWPGEITPELAAFVRDLLIDMRTKMLAHENRAAVRVGTEGAAGNYRVASDEPLPAEEAEADAAAERAG